MKKLFLFLIVIALLFLPATTSAERLVCDIPSDTVFACQVSIDGAVVPGVMDVGPAIRIYTDEDGKDWMELLDESTIASLESGRHIFMARIQDPSGWWSDWSGPLDAGKPGTLGNVGIKGN